MHLLDFYRDPRRHDELREILAVAAQHHPDGLPDFFLEKDIWVSEVLRLLFDEGLLGEHKVAFKGGTALSKCWKAIDRFSEDIDLSIHWADLAGVEDEVASWEHTTQSRKQRDKFRKQQQKRLTEWSLLLVDALNLRFHESEIPGLKASLEEGSHGEKINIHFPAVTRGENHYHLDHVLLEFGGRSRGQPTVAHKISTYLAEVPELSSIDCPQATVQAYDPAYILWEKLTALHQFSTMEREPNPHRLARHWYDVDCLLQRKLADPLGSSQAREDVVDMKQRRWAENGVDYTAVLRGGLKLIPESERLAGIARDHKAAIAGRMFYVNRQPDSFEQIIDRIANAQDRLNKAFA